MDAGDHLLIGTDLVKDPARIVAAYDDASRGHRGVQPQRAAGAQPDVSGQTFDPERFDHVALWNAEEEWIEMRLRSRCDQAVTVADLDMTVAFDAGEELLTEISAKFTPERVVSELAGVDFVVDGQWGADDGEFLLTLAHPYC